MLFELPKKEPIKNKSLFSKCMLEIDSYTNNMELHKSLVDYLVIRLAMKDKPLYGVNQWKGLLNKLSSLAPDTSTQIKIVKQSIERGWATFVELNSTLFRNKFGEYRGMSCSTDDEEEVKGYF